MSEVLYLAAEGFCHAQAAGDNEQRRVARMVGRRHFDVWLMPMDDGRVALVYGHSPKGCGMARAMVSLARREHIAIRRL